MPHAKKVLYVNHSEKRCGVHQFGANVAAAIRPSTRYDIRYVECDAPRELARVVRDERPDAILYNYHPRTLGWARRNALRYAFPQIGTIHEVHQAAADTADDLFFDFHVAPDPTLLLKNPIVFKTGRLVPRYEGKSAPPATPTIGSFGFGTPGKGFEALVARVQDEFDEATVRLNIPTAPFGDADGRNARAIADACRALVRKPGIRVEVSHEFLDDGPLLDFLAGNTINVFLYAAGGPPRGISSVVDYALAVRRPLAVSESAMFRHVHAAAPSVVIPPASLRGVIQAGVEALEPLVVENTAENLLWDYERILDAVFHRDVRGRAKKLARIAWRRARGGRAAYSSWALHDAGGPAATTPRSTSRYQPAAPVAPLNRILDDDARRVYEPVVRQLWDHVPALMTKKLAEANVQQAFVLDTAVRLAKRFDSPRILAVGAYEDTAVETLKRLGYDVTAIDPVLNYDLHTFLSKPGALDRKFDIVVSTSVIEHVPDDVTFVRDIARAMHPGSVAILTCDYDDRYRPGDPIPDVDCRLYTQADIKTRLMTSIPDCTLTDEPRWDCPSPDFLYLGKYRYTFASIVFEKAR